MENVDKTTEAAYFMERGGNLEDLGRKALGLGSQAKERLGVMMYNRGRDEVVFKYGTQGKVHRVGDKADQQA